MLGFLLPGGAFPVRSGVPWKKKIPFLERGKRGASSCFVSMILPGKDIEALQMGIAQTDPNILCSLCLPFSQSRCRIFIIVPKSLSQSAIGSALRVTAPWPALRQVRTAGVFQLVGDHVRPIGTDSVVARNLLQDTQYRQPVDRAGNVN